MLALPRKYDTQYEPNGSGCWCGVTLSSGSPLQQHLVTEEEGVQGEWAVPVCLTSHLAQGALSLSPFFFPLFLEGFRFCLLLPELNFQLRFLLL